MHLEGFAAVVRQLLEHQQHEFVDLGLQLELELRRRQFLPRPIRHVNEVTHAFCQLQPTIVIVCCRCARRRRRNHQRHLEPSFTLPQQERLTFSKLGSLPHEPPHVGRRFQMIETLQPPLQPPERRELLGQCRPPAPRFGRTPRCISSLPKSSEPVFSQRSYSLSTAVLEGAAASANFSATALSRSAKRSKFSASSKNKSGALSPDAPRSILPALS